jgi:hypothetical protein
MRMISERHGALTIREIIASMGHDGCGGGEPGQFTCSCSHRSNRLRLPSTAQSG